MNGYAGRLIVHDRVMHLEPALGVELAAGDTVEVIRGNGPREGDYMGSAIVTGFDDDGRPMLVVDFDNGPRVHCPPRDLDDAGDEAGRSTT